MLRNNIAKILNNLNLIKDWDNITVFIVERSVKLEIIVLVVSGFIQNNK